MTTKTMDIIIEKGMINLCNKSDRKKIFNYAFGVEFMQSKNKGSLKQY